MRTYTIGDNKFHSLTELGFPVIDLPTIEEKEIHDFVINKLVPLKADKFIIYISSEHTLGLQLGLHIRLTSEMGISRHCALIFVANETLLSIIKTADNYGQLLATKGCYFEEFTLMLKKKIDCAISLKEEDYFIDFYNKISIKPDEMTGRHSMANEWGAIRFAEVSGNSNLLDGELAIKDTTKSLYFKYLNTQKKNSTINKTTLKRKINNSNKNVLFIDDEVEKGWGSIIKSVFTNPNNVETIGLQSQEKFSSFYSRSRDRALKLDPNGIPIWDIIILDLRLDPNEDLGDNSSKLANEFSGAKLLSEIKNLNQGIQVIIFTASNKAWNMRELMNMGANGFYIKESPEFNWSFSYSENNYYNFIYQTNNCLNSSFQKKLYVKYLQMKGMLGKQYVATNTEYNTFISSLKMQLEIAISSIMSIDFNKSITLDIAFLSFFNFLELFKGYYLKYNNEDYHYDLGFEDVPLYVYSINNNKLTVKDEFVAKNRYDSPSWFVTLAALFIDYFKISGLSSSQEIFNLKKNADMRNDYIHSTKQSFTINELEMIVDSCYKVCKAIKE